MFTTAIFMGVTAQLALIIGSCVVIAIALFVLARSILAGGGIYTGLKKALGIVWRNLP